MTTVKYLTLTYLIWMVLTRVSQGALPDRNSTIQYPFTTDLDHDGEYVMRWGFNDTVIWIEVQVHTLGYVGFGISESGKMAPADVLVAYVANNQVHFRDYRTDGYSHPVEDVSQDWFVDYGYEEDKWTVLAFHRRLDTCDKAGDRVITTNHGLHWAQREETLATSTSDTTRIIFSYSYRDPVNLDSLTWHDKRGSKSVPLLTTSPPPRFLPSDSQTMNLLNENYPIPDNEMTTFHCRVFDLGNITAKHHIIKVSPVLSEATEHYVHHMILYRCHVKNPGSLIRNGNSFNCFTDAPYHIQFCREHVASFGHGHSDLYLPEDVGIPFGGPEEPNVYLLATQYENEDFLPNLVDNSGIRITYTSQLRQHDAAFLSLGNIISPNWSQFIPPGYSNFVQKAYCSRKCLAWGMGDCRDMTTSVPMTVVGVQFHSHSLGRAMKLRHLTYEARNRARENPWLAYDRKYDSDQQEFRLLKDRRNVSCWDSLLLECSYNSSGINRPTVGGWSEYDEICRGYVLYYPRKQIEGCMSWGNYDQLTNNRGRRVSGNDVFRTLVTTDWANDATMRRNLKHALDYSWENGQCWSSSPKRRHSYAIDLFRQPVITNKYREQPTSKCL